MSPRTRRRRPVAGNDRLPEARTAGPCDAPRGLGYPGKLLPFDLAENGQPDVALMVELVDSDASIGQSIPTTMVAYNNAHLVNRTDGDWFDTSLCLCGGVVSGRSLAFCLKDPDGIILVAMQPVDDWCPLRRDRSAMPVGAGWAFAAIASKGRHREGDRYPQMRLSI